MGKSEEIRSVIAKRTPFSYRYTREACMRRLSAWYCCCCKPRPRRRDRLFKDARSKLYEEIDILEIIKKLRVNKFTSEIVLKPGQRDLVNFFEEYKLSADPPQPPPITLLTPTEGSKQKQDNLLVQNPSVLSTSVISNPSVLGNSDETTSLADRVMIAVQDTDPDNDRIDGFIYSRIVSQDIEPLSARQILSHNRLSA